MTGVQPGHGKSDLGKLKTVIVPVIVSRFSCTVIVSIGGTGNRFPLDSIRIFDVENSNFVIYT